MRDMAGKRLEQFREAPFDDCDPHDLVEKLPWGNVRRGLEKLRIGGNRYIKVFMYPPSDSGVQGTIRAMAREIASGHTEGAVDEGVYLEGEWQGFGFFCVAGFEPDVVRQVVLDYMSRMRGSKGSPDSIKVGMIDFEDPGKGDVRLGEIDLALGVMTTVVIDKRMI